MEETTRWAILSKAVRVTTNQTVVSNRIHTIEQLRFLSYTYSCWKKSYFVIKLSYFDVSILMCYSFKKFKRVSLSDRFFTGQTVPLWLYRCDSQTREQKLLIAGTSQCSVVLILLFALFYY